MDINRFENDSIIVEDIAYKRKPQDICEHGSCWRVTRKYKACGCEVSWTSHVHGDVFERKSKKYFPCMNINCIIKANPKRDKLIRRHLYD